MSSLTGKTPSATYKSLLKIDGLNQEIDGTLRSITDGSGNSTGLTIDNAGNFTASGTLTWSGGSSANANTAFGWGNHAGLYPVVAGYNNANWDTAYGWGDHSAEIDGDIATHAALASAHHTKYTDGEVDAIVATHTALAGAHHTKYALTEDLASTEITALQNINTETITITQWGYLGAMGGQPLETFSESDPIFVAHEANNITAQMITDLGNLSNINSGDQVIPTDFVSAANGGTFLDATTIKHTATGGLVVTTDTAVAVQDYALTGQRDDFIIYNSGEGGMTIAGEGSQGIIAFSDGVTGSERYAGIIGYQHSSDQFVFGTNGNVEALTLLSTQGVKLNSYGIGTFTGTAAKYLAVDSSGNIIEEASGGGATEIDGLSDGKTDATNVSLGLGTGALAGDIDKPTRNVAIGYNALNASPDGEYNVAIGYTALLVNDADSNTAIGAFALSSNSIGDSNMAIGRLALTNNLGGNNNMAIGKACMHRNTSGTGNSTMGHQALYYNIDGSSNVAIGHQAGEHTGASAQVVTATQCVIVGSDADFNTTTPTNEMVFGYATDGIGDNNIAMGNTSITDAKAQVSWTTYSDERIKRNIEDADLGLDFISALRPVRFQKVNPADYPEAILERRFKRRVTQHDDEDEVVREPDERPADNDSWNHGLVAQEVKAALDSLGIESDIWNQNPNGKQGVKYEALVVPLIKAVQELSSRVIELEK